MFFNAGGIGRGESYNKVCEADALIGRIEGNTFHGNGVFVLMLLILFRSRLMSMPILYYSHSINRAVWNLLFGCV